MTPNQLRTFLEVQRAGSVHGAAERLVLSQPAVSASVASLERELGVELVARQGRGLVVTESGEALARYAAQILGLIAEARQEVKTTSDPTRGVLRLAAVTTAGEHVLPPLLQRFRARYPRVEIVLEVGNRRDVWERLRDRAVNLVVSGRPPAGSPFTSREFLPNELVLVGPAEPHKRKAKAKLDELAERTWLLREHGSGTRSTAEEFLASAGLSPPILTIGSNGSIVRLVGLGLGVALISRNAAGREIEEGAIRVLSVEGLPLRRAWHIAWRSDAPPIGAGALFADLLGAKRGAP